MLSPLDCIKKYGKPEDHKNLVMWDVPAELEVGIIPKRLYCNKDLIGPLSAAFIDLIKTGAVKELKTFDGCFNIRVQRGYEKEYQTYMNVGNLEKASKFLSIHCWAVAIDVNAFENGLGRTPKLSPEFVKCFTDNGFDWGGNWKRLDGMHFQLSKI